MRVPHFVVLVGRFVQEEVEGLFRRRGIKLKSFKSNNNGSHNLVICFNPRRISDKRIVEILENKDQNKRAAIIPMADWEKRYDKQTRELVPAE